jgi:hypothetical protein
MPARGMQAEHAADLPSVAQPSMQPGQASALRPSRLLEDPDEARDRQVAQIAGAVSALARKVEAIDRPPVTMASRRAALDTALEYFTGLNLGRPPKVEEMIDISRYLTGE